MKLSIFKKAKALPSKEEKGKEARFASKPYVPEIVDFKTHEELIDIITSYVWSPSIFKEFRRQDGFISTDLMVLDIDEDMRIEEAEKIIHNLDVITLVLPTTSHTPEHHKFRIIFPLSKTITKPQVFEATMRKLAEYFPADTACVGDQSRFYFGSTMESGFWYGDGKLLDPVAPEKPKKAAVKRYDSREPVVVGETIEELVEVLFKEQRDTIPDCIAYFLENAHTGLHGEFHNSANSFLFTCGLMNCEYEDIAAVFEQVCPEPLDQHDLYLLERATQDGYNARED